MNGYLKVIPWFKFKGFCTHPKDCTFTLAVIQTTSVFPWDICTQGLVNGCCDLKISTAQRYLLIGKQA